MDLKEYAGWYGRLGFEARGSSEKSRTANSMYHSRHAGGWYRTEVTMTSPFQVP